MCVEQREKFPKYKTLRVQALHPRLQLSSQFLDAKHNTITKDLICDVIHTAAKLGCVKRKQ